MTTPYEQLERVFHEPNRLAIMSALIQARSGRGFSELKVECNLTDGNLSRHLKHLEEYGAVKITKKFKNKKPLTTVKVSAKGRNAFIKYLGSLEQVLLAATKAAQAGDKISSDMKLKKA